MLKKCAICGKEFESRYRCKYCSAECREQAERSRYESCRQEGNDTTAPKGVCIYCGKELSPQYNSQKYCSAECCKKHNVKRATAKRTEKRKEIRVAFEALGQVYDPYHTHKFRKKSAKKKKRKRCVKPQNTGSAAQCERLKDLLLQRRLTCEFKEATSYEDTQTFGGIDDAF